MFIRTDVIIIRLLQSIVKQFELSPAKFLPARAAQACAFARNDGKKARRR